MGLLPKRERSPTTSLVAYALASGVPLAAYLATASAHAHWLDTGEMVEAAVQLDISHPPGHPLAALVGHALTFLPLGPLALRVALAQAACAAIACGFLFSALDTTARALGVAHDRVSIPLALGGTWLVGTSYGFWLQAVRPEVYALSTMLIVIAIERVVALEAAWPTTDVRPFYVACLALGLALANHHFMAVLALPAIAPTAARVFGSHGRRALATGVLAGLAGLAVYVYLPVRSGADPPVDLGNPTSLDRFFWVVSAQAYSDPERIATTSLVGRAAEVLAALLENLSPVPLVLAVAGLYALLRTPGARRIGFVWLALTAVSLAGRSWLGHTEGNPDALGYLGPALAGLGALTVAFLAAVASQIGGGTKSPPRVVVLVAIGMAALGLAQLGRSRARASLATFHATDDFDDMRYRSLPPRAVVVLHRPDTVFRHYACDAEEALRPDLTLVPVPFLGYPGMVDRLLERDPAVRDLLGGYFRDLEIRAPDLQSLAGRRPVVVEMDTRVPISLYETLLPSGLYYEVSDAGVTDSEVELAALARAQRLARLDRDASDGLSPDPHTRGELLWVHYHDALYYASLGALDAARESTARALALSPESDELRRLSIALAAPGLRGPIDTEPFRVR